MESKGGSVKSMTASLKQKKWTAILEEFDQGESGSFLFLKSKEEVFLRREISKPQPSSLVIADGQAIFYQPILKQAHHHRLGNSRDKTEFMILGFGSDRESLETAYEISLLGDEQLDGVKTYQIEMLPRSEKAQAYFTRIILWIDSKRWIPVQQKLVEPTDDYLLVRFYNIILNPRLRPRDFKITLPKDTQIVGLD
jgi:outer membrane lipoprotein-sorting protein